MRDAVLALLGGDETGHRYRPIASSTQSTAAIMQLLPAIQTVVSARGRRTLLDLPEHAP